jgi:hypothetical protein
LTIFVVHGQRWKLPHLDQFGICIRPVHLNVQQEPAVSQDAGGIDDAGGLLVPGDEDRVVDGDLDELAGIEAE